MSTYEEFLKTHLCKYKYPLDTKQDVLTVFTTFRDLRPKVEDFVFADGMRKTLLHLSGTIPVKHKGRVYNIPICIWLLDTHPYNPPMVFVKPTSTMQIKSGRFVDTNGEVDVPYLREWNYASSDLLGMIQILTLVFGEDPPVYFSKQVPQQQPAPRHQVLSTSQAESISAGSDFEMDNVISKQPDSLIASIKDNKYKHPDLTQRDVLSVFTTFTDLRPKVENFVFADGTTKTLLQLDGCIPVIYRGCEYNIPICIWLKDTHPFNPPMVFVKPTSTMQIKSGRNVDMNGKIDIPYLREWKYPSSDLLGMIQILTIVFGEEPPVYSRTQTSQQQPAPRQPVLSTSQAESISAGSDFEMDDVISKQPDSLIASIKDNKYKHPDLTQRDVLSVFTTFTDLRPKVEDFVFSDGVQKSLLQLAGTIPVIIKGLVFNIPICIWLFDTHPYNPPMVFVKPTSTMQIKAGRYVDMNGKVDCPCLREWKYPSSDLLGMIQILTIVFGEEPPVYSRTQAPQKQPASRHPNPQTH